MHRLVAITAWSASRMHSALAYCSHAWSSLLFGTYRHNTVQKNTDTQHGTYNTSKYSYKLPQIQYVNTVTMILLIHCNSVIMSSPITLY